MNDAASDNESGHGLMIVDALSERWGYYHPAHRSKAVWAELFIPLPKREPEHLDVPPVTAMDDPRVLHRVHTGLKNLQVPLIDTILAGWSRAAPENRTEIYHMRDTWEMTVRTAANTMLRYPDKISDGLEAELYALLEKLDTAQEDQD